MKSYHKYLTITSLEERWGIYATTIGYSKIRANQAYPNAKEHPNSHQFNWNSGRILNGFYLVFISKGKGVFESAHSNNIEVNAGTCFFLFPDVWHRYKPHEASGWEEYWIGFNGYYAAQLMRSGFFSADNPVINVGLNAELLIRFQELISAVKKANTGYHQMIAGNLLQLLSLVYHISVYDEDNATDDATYIAKAKFLLQESNDSNLNLYKLAESLTVSYSKFRKDFKYVTGLSPRQYHLNIRLKKAIELLQSTNLTITEIAEQTGFESVFYFSRLFKKKVGSTPTAYRQKTNKK